MKDQELRTPAAPKPTKIKTKPTKTKGNTAKSKTKGPKAKAAEAHVPKPTEPDYARGVLLGALITLVEASEGRVSEFRLLDQVHHLILQRIRAVDPEAKRCLAVDVIDRLLDELDKAGYLSRIKRDQFERERVRVTPGGIKLFRDLHAGRISVLPDRVPVVELTSDLKRDSQPPPSRLKDARLLKRGGILLESVRVPDRLFVVGPYTQNRGKHWWILAGMGEDGWTRARYARNQIGELVWQLCLEREQTNLKGAQGAKIPLKAIAELTDSADSKKLAHALARLLHDMTISGPRVAGRDLILDGLPRLVHLPRPNDWVPE